MSESGDSRVSSTSSAQRDHHIRPAGPDAFRNRVHHIDRRLWWHLGKRIHQQMRLQQRQRHLP